MELAAKTTHGGAEDQAVTISDEMFGGKHPDHCPVCGARAESSGRNEGACPSCGHLLWFASEQVHGVTVIRLLDNRVAVMELLELLEHAVGTGEMDRIVLNFGTIQQVSSAALGKLLKLAASAEAVRGKLRLCNLHPDLLKVFRITRLDCLFHLHETQEDALAGFAA
jgi:anti-sigma B factor antagonist